MSTQPSEEKQLLEQVLRQLLPGSMVSLVNPEKRAIAVFQEASSLQNRIEFLTPNEWKVLLALAESYPHYSSYEALLAQLTAMSLKYCRERLHAARDYETWQRELRPVRDALSSLRAKLRPFTLTVASLHGLGYLLTSRPANT